MQKPLEVCDHEGLICFNMHMKNTSIPKVMCKHCLPNCADMYFTTSGNHAQMDTREEMVNIFKEIDFHGPSEIYNANVYLDEKMLHDFKNATTYGEYKFKEILGSQEEYQRYATKIFGFDT